MNSISSEYKQTTNEGFPSINNPWSKVRLGTVITLQRGYDLPHRERKLGLVPIITSSGFGETHSEALVQAPGVVTGRYGTIGNVFVVHEDFWPLNTTLYVRDFHGNNPFFVAHLLRTIDFHLHSGKSGVPGVNRNDLHEIEVELPPIPEQRAIAAALSDVDALLAAQDKLIAKKRDIKQAAMQQLLTGKQRLPGFSGEWEMKRLGDLGATYGGLTGKTKADFGEGAARYITFMNIMTNVVIDCGSFERVRVSPVETQNRAKKGDLFFNGSSETPEEVAMCAVLLEEVQDVYLNSFCFGFRFREGAEADGVFFAYYLRSREGRELMKSLAQGSTRYNLSKVALLNSLLRLPTLSEQLAIAIVLSDMDADLAALEQQRDKTRAVKQGMMQELLTGRIRLV